MRFVGREKEVEMLRRFRQKSSRAAQFMVLTGRRRVGKTALLREALDDGVLPYVHLPITRQSEQMLVVELQEEVERVLSIGIHGVCRSFAELFAELMSVSKNRRFTLVLDEFQEFRRINPSVFSQIAAIWDRDHVDSRINLVVCGSINRLMTQIFFNDGEPLYGRNTGSYVLKPFKVSLLKKIISQETRKWSPDDLLALWTITGGVPRYVNLLVEGGAMTRKAMLDLFFEPGSSFLTEGRAILAEEFGPDYGIYFSILSAIASGATTSAELKTIVGADVNGYLTKLEDQYALVAKKQPVFGKESSKNCHFMIDDCFFRFWFRFVFKYRGALELERNDQVRAIAERDFDAFSGYALERYFHWKFVEEKTYTTMGSWWNRKGEEEIDLVCEDETAGIVDFYEVKREAARYQAEKLAGKVERFFEKHPQKRHLRHSQGCLSLQDL